jgi:hypothetical protein
VAAWDRAEPAACPLEGLCSECGLKFAWVDVLRPDRHLPGWSFEHAASRALMRLPGTWLRAALAPWLWWRLRMGHAVVVWRVVAFAVVCLLGFHVACTVLAAWAALANQTMVARLPGAALDPVAGLGTLLLDPYQPWPVGTRKSLVSYWAWWAVIGTLCIPTMFLVLGGTFARLRIRRAHLARAAAYSLAMLPCIALVFVAPSAVPRGWGTLGMLFSLRERTAVTRLYRASSWMDGVLNAVDSRPWMAVGAVMVWTGVFWYAYSRLYLKLPRPGSTTSMLLVAAWLLALVVAGLWPGSYLFAVIGTRLFGQAA